MSPSQSFFKQRTTYALDNIAFNLVLHAIGIYDEAAVVGAEDALNTHLAGCFIDLPIRDCGDVGIESLQIKV